MNTHIYTDGQKKSDLYYKLPGSGRNHSTKRSSGNDKFFTDSSQYKSGRVNALNPERSVATDAK